MDTTPWVGWKHGPWKTGENGDQKPGADGTFSGFLRRNRKTIRLSPVSVQAIDGAGGGRAVHGQREVAAFPGGQRLGRQRGGLDRKSTRLNSSHANISYAV